MAEEKLPKKSVTKYWADLAKGELAKEAVKAVLYYLGGVVLLGLTAVVPEITDLGRDPNGAFTFKQLWIDLKENPPFLWDFLFGEWWRTAIIFAVLGLAVGSLRLFLRYRRQVTTYFKQIADVEQVFETIGFHSVWKVEQSDEAWKLLLSEIQDARTHALWILGASGWETFGSDKAPLRDALRAFSGDVRIVLIDPKSESVGVRANSVGVRVADYRREIAEAHALINTMKGKAAHIDVRFYDHSPGWKLIITPRFCWVQYYSANSHVQDTPVYLFQNSSSEASLYRRFNWEFIRVWENCKKNEPNGGGSGGAGRGRRRGKRR
jgi:hypothetical protein